MIPLMHSSTVLAHRNSILASHKVGKSQTFSSYPYTLAFHANWCQESGAGTVNSTHCHLQCGSTALNIIFCSTPSSSPAASAAKAADTGATVCHQRRMWPGTSPARSMPQASHRCAVVLRIAAASPSLLQGIGDHALDEIITEESMILLSSIPNVYA